MAAKISLEDLESSLKSLVDALVHATKQAQWDGIGGASSYLEGGRIDVIEKRHGSKMKLGALKIIFENIATATTQAFDPIVLKKFAETNFDVIKSYARQNPRFFVENENITEICRKALSPKEKRSLDRLVKIAKSSATESSMVL